MAEHFAPLFNQMVHDAGLCPADFICTQNLSALLRAGMLDTPKGTAEPACAGCTQAGLVCHLSTPAVPSLRSLPTKNVFQKKPATLGVRALEELVSAA